MRKKRFGGDWLLRSTAVLLALIGLLVGCGGTLLLSLGGSAYYLVGGAVVLASAILLWRRSVWGAHLYGAFLLATLAWAIWEQGLDSWGLAARVIAPSLVGMALGVPWVRRRLASAAEAQLLAWSAFGAGSLSLLVLCGAGLYNVDVSGTKAAIVTKAVRATGSPDEWPEFGRTAAGDRYSHSRRLRPLTLLLSSPLGSIMSAKCITGLRVHSR